MSSSASRAAGSLTLYKPDDFHLHLRDGAVLADTATAAARQFHYATIMPNLQPPITTAQQAVEYRQRILRAIRLPSHSFTPLMTLYLTVSTTPDTVREAKATGLVHAFKLYPAGATTHSAAGVPLHDASALRTLAATFEAMADCGLLLLIHGEVTDPSVDVFDREAAFLSSFLPGLLSSHPRLRVVLEHITTAAAVAFVLSRPSGQLAASITAHHLLANRNAIFSPMLNPHHYCLPVLKTESDRLALLQAATSGDGRFFAGTDSAPHSESRKQREGCAGCYTAFAALEMYAEAFDRAGKLDQLEDFVSCRGRQWYGLQSAEQEAEGGRKRETVQLVKEQWTVPAALPFGDERVVPFMAGQTLSWRLQATQTMT